MGNANGQPTIARGVRQCSAGSAERNVRRPRPRHSALAKWVHVCGARGNRGRLDRVAGRVEGTLNSLYGASRFCVVLRGDTAASKRLQATMLAGRVPLVCSDHYVQPFASLKPTGPAPCFEYPKSAAPMPSYMSCHTLTTGNGSRCTQRCSWLQSR